jgi:hypothetical protein
MGRLKDSPGIYPMTLIMWKRSFLFPGALAEWQDHPCCLPLSQKQYLMLKFHEALKGTSLLPSKKERGSYKLTPVVALPWEINADPPQWDSALSPMVELLESL